MRYLLPNVIRTRFFQPNDVDTPEGGDPRQFLYHYTLSPMDVQEITIPMHEDVVLWSATGNFTGASNAAVDVFTQIYHVHSGIQIPLWSKPAPLSIAFGTGPRPNPFSTRFLPQNDQLTIKVRSTDRNNLLNVECALFGATVNWNQVGRMQKAVLESKRKVLDSWVPQVSPQLSNRRWVTHLSPVPTTYPAPGAGPVVVSTYKVPPGQTTEFYQHALQHNGSNPPEISNSGVIWRFLVDGWPLDGMGVVTAQIGNFATPAKTIIPLYENQIFQVTVEVPSTSIGQEGSCGYMADAWTAPNNIASSSSTNAGSVQ